MVSMFSSLTFSVMFIMINKKEQLESRQGIDDKIKKLL